MKTMNESTTQNFIEVKNISKSYQIDSNTISAINGVNLSIAKGSIVALMGPSGSGKSTLLNLLGVLDRPTDGEIIIDGCAINNFTSDEQAEFRNQSVGFIFQNFNLIPVLSTLENVLLPSQLSRTADLTESKKRAVELIETVGITPQINQSVNRLSGGQMQRTAIARALINKPKLILADEPTANLDEKTAESVLELLSTVCKDQGATIIIATHDPSVLSYCQRIIRLRDGKIIDDQVA